MLPFIIRNLNRFSNSYKGIRSLRTGNPDGLVADINKKEDVVQRDVLDYRFVYPEFLPDPKIEFRNQIREKLERQDMIARRGHTNIPEFYVGSIVAVESADQHTPGKKHRFVGICIQRGACGLRAHFTLRNVIDHQGVEIYYEMYDPSLHKIEVLRLEKRLDDELLYLRDALPEYSTFDPDMQVEILQKGMQVPVNPVKVKLKPRPWVQSWEKKNLHGVQDLGLPEKFYKRAEKSAKPWEKYDLMKQYMNTIPEEEQKEILTDIKSKLKAVDLSTKLKKKRVFVKPVKLA